MDQTVIVISLRGGADGLNMIVPYQEANYYNQRPTIAIPAPNNSPNAALDLDGFFGFHPALAPLLPLYKDQQLALVHAVGWPGDTHSHFQAWADIESGTLDLDRPNTGWLARYLQMRNPKTNSPLRAVAFGDLLPRILTGAMGVSTLQSLKDFQLRTTNSRMSKALGSLYQGSDLLGKDAGQTIEALDTIRSLAQTPTTGYPDTDFGQQLHALEQLVRANIGLAAAHIELRDWDTHIIQGTTSGGMAHPLQQLATGLATFTQHLAAQRDRLLIIVMTEFGRRVAENGSNGTDHGQGSVMFLWGGGLRGGKVYTDWPGLAPHQLADPGDLRITTDFRDVLSEVLALEGREVATIFPHYQVQSRLGLLNH